MKSKIILSIICLLVVSFILILFFYKDKKDDSLKDIIDIDLDISSIDNKLGNEIDISFDYLSNYILKKSNIWYRSNGIISDISKKDNYIKYKISIDKKSYIIAYYDKKNDYKVNDKIYFIFTMDFNNSIKLVKISKDYIDYNSVIDIDLNDLYSHLDLLSKSKFNINGYLVTVKDKYYFYSNKDSYLKKVKDYYVINWDGDPLYTGNGNVRLSCSINNIYSLNNCIVIEN